jgi:large subunit ribosomal protein L21
MKYVVFQSGGKQYRASVGDILEVEHLAIEKDKKVTFGDILLHTDGESTHIGTPFVAGFSMSAVVLDHVKGDKIRVAKFKAKSRHRRVMGHRQSLTRIKIEEIIGGKSANTEAQRKTEVQKEKSVTPKAKKITQSKVAKVE